MKKILFLILCFFAGIGIVNASSIDSINMDIVLDEYGTATITETWKAYVNQGTEGWHPYYNLADSNIRVIEASMDGVSFEVEDYWNESRTLSEKAYKAGIYQVNNDETDVVFGISNYGNHTYKIVYEITNFVKETTDSQIIYWQLFPYDFSSQPGRVDIKVTGPNDFPDTIDVWGYGKYGALCYVDNGAIYMSTDGESIATDEYLTLLAKFPLETFNLSSKLDNDFNHYYEMAQEGAEVYKEPGTTMADIIGGIIAFVGNIIVWGLVIAGLSRVSNKSKINYTFGEVGKTLPKDRDINSFRDIPCNKDIYRAFWVADTYGLIKSKNDFLGVVLLKWIYDGNVTVQTNTKKKVFKDKKEDVIIFNKEPDANEHERNLYRYMLEASIDGVLEKDEFKKWCKNHYSKVLNWFDNVETYEYGKLSSDKQYIDNVMTKGMFGSEKQVVGATELLNEKAAHMAGLKKFFKEFDNMGDKQAIEVNIWI